MDHYLPKTKFSEFIVHPRNLFPCCLVCNTYKNENWLIARSRVFLNLYLDKLPDVQFLFVDVSSVSGVPDIVFRLGNQNGIEPSLFNIIENHYEHLHLIERFNERAPYVISELVNMVKIQKRHGIANEMISTLIIESEKETQKSMGINYWQGVLKIALASNAQFITKI